LLKNKMACFAAKRVLLCCVILSIISIVCFESKWHIVGGLLTGGLLSIIKFASYIWIFKRILSPGIAVTGGRGRASASGGVLVFALNQIILLPLLYLSYILSRWFFAGIVAGILLVPFVIMINSITEALGITKNNFE
jgi:hypothetical protein